METAARTALDAAARARAAVARATARRGRD